MGELDMADLLEELHMVDLLDMPDLVDMVDLLEELDMEDLLEELDMEVSLVEGLLELLLHLWPVLMDSPTVESSGAKTAIMKVCFILHRTQQFTDVDTQNIQQT